VAVDAAQIEPVLLLGLQASLISYMGLPRARMYTPPSLPTLFGKPVWKVTEEDYESSLHNPEELRGIKIQRGFGKDAILGCVAEGTSILTDSGHKPIQDITVNDRVWDGHSFVHHQGVVPKGKKKCININGTWLTPEHEILTWDGWTTAAELSTHNHSQEWFMENLRWLRSQKGTCGGIKSVKCSCSCGRTSTPSRDNLVSGKSTRCTVCAERASGKTQSYKTHVGNPSRARLLNRICAIISRCETRPLERYGKRGIRVWPKWVNDRVAFIEYLATLPGYDNPELEIDRTNNDGGMNQEISGLLHDGSIGSILAGETPGSGNRSNVRGAGQCSREKHQFKSSVANTAQAVLPTYDILNAGRWHRFQTDGLMCSNCGYGMGSDKFFDRCYTNDALRPMFDSGQYDKVFIEQLVKTYRRKYDRIPAFWKQVEKLFRWPIKYPGQSTSYEVEGRELLKFNMVGSDLQMTLPSGRVMYYRHASVNADGEIKYKGGPKWCYLWGGSITENLIQALCRDLFGGWLLEIERRGHKVVHHCHDETITCVPDHRAEAVMADMIDVMTHGPEWSEGLPFATDEFISKAYKK